MKGMVVNMEILRVENLTKIYGNGENKVVALDDISFSVNKGEFVSIVRSVRFWKIYFITLIRRS